MCPGSSETAEPLDGASENKDLLVKTNHLCNNDPCPGSSEEEQELSKLLAAGSNPARGTIFRKLRYTAFHHSPHLMPKSAAYKRIMLKLSGEVFSGPQDYGIHKPTLDDVAKQINAVCKLGLEVVVVVGGGNIWRFRDTKDSGIERTASDAMGMLATIMNSVALQSALESLGAETRVLSAVDVPQLAEPFIKRRAERHIEKKRIVICSGGTGNPYFTTDSAAALRALELGCDVLLKATNVDGIYDVDPRKNKNAVMFDELSYTEVIEKHLAVMDQAAFSLCEEQQLPIVVFNFFKNGLLLKAAKGEKVGTLVHK